MPRTYKIDGMTYREIERTTIANDFYNMKQFRAAGLGDCLRSETPEDFARGIVNAVIENGVPLTLLGGTLLPEGVPDEKWTPEQAEATAARLAVVSEPEDKKLIQQIIVAVVTSFFAAGLLSLKPLLPVLQEAEQSGTQPDLPAMPAGRQAQTGGMNFSMTTENGEPSYVN